MSKPCGFCGAEASESRVCCNKMREGVARVNAMFGDKPQVTPDPIEEAAREFEYDAYNLAAMAFFGCDPEPERGEHGRACLRMMPYGCVALAALLRSRSEAERDAALLEAKEVALSAKHLLPEDRSDDDDLDKTARYSNSTCQIIANAIDALRRRNP